MEEVKCSATGTLRLRKSLIIRTPVFQTVEDGLDVFPVTAGHRVHLITEALVAFGPVGDGVWVVFDALAEIFEDSSRI